MKWLVTGGCGFIGSSLIGRLLAEGGHQIRVLDNLSVGTREDLRRVTDFNEVTPANLDNGWGSGHEIPAELIVGDILDENLVLKVSKGADAIVHFAANTGVEPSVKDPRTDCVTNVLGTFNCLDSARLNSVPRVVYASSGAALGECVPPLHEELVPHPVSPYGASKLCGEAYCSSFFRTFGVHTASLRFSNVYGPGSTHKQSAVAKFIKRARNGEVLEVYGDGTQTRDFIYIDDLVEAVVKAATVDGIGSEVFQIATNRETSVHELIEHMIPVLGEFGIEGVEVIHSAPRLGDVQRNYSDTSKAREMLGWEVQVELDEGLRRTVEWFVKGCGPTASA